MPDRTLKPIRGVLLDIDGVVTVGGVALPGSLDAIKKIRARGLPLKFITNTTRRPRRRVVEELRQAGLEVALDDVLTPAILAHDFLKQQKLTPLLTVHPDLREDFADVAAAKPADAVVIGDAGDTFTYAHLNEAFRRLIHGAAFLALARNRNFLDRDGELSLDAGPFVTALEYAARREAIVLGKPAADFFRLAVESLGVARAEAVMIGDDAESDVEGAMAAGLKGILVRTGKYRTGHESLLKTPPDRVVDDLAAAIDLLLG